MESIVVYARRENHHLLRRRWSIPLPDRESECLLCPHPENFDSDYLEEQQAIVDKVNSAILTILFRRELYC